MPKLLNMSETNLKRKGTSSGKRMRSYYNGYDRAKPPAEDFPLFLDRETGRDSDHDADNRVPLKQRKRQTMHEKLRSTAANQADPPDLPRNLKA